MKICDKIKQLPSERPFFSFEYFPPKTDEGVANLLDRISRMAKLHPLFVAFTWGAGGSTEEKTKDLAFTAQNEYKLNTLLHLTCTNMQKSKVDQALQDAREQGVRNILALRGDPPRGEEYWVPNDSNFSHATDLVRYIRAKTGDYFCIGVAGYPEGHPDSLDKKKDLDYLKEKVDAGANFILTQLFYDNDAFLIWRDECRKIGIRVPIIPCIMPIQSYSSFRRMTNLCKLHIPEKILRELENIKNDDQAVKDKGVELAASTIIYLLQHHVQGFHISTLNLEKSVRLILEKVGLSSLVANGAVDAKTITRRRLSMDSQNSIIRHELTKLGNADDLAVSPHEAADPTLWTSSADADPGVGRSATWDDFPNGRYGDARSPAYGELDGWGVSLKLSPDEARALWGFPVTHKDISDIFLRYIKGQCRCIPWCDEAPYPETQTIRNELEKIISRGWWTVGSQPAVDGEYSSHPVFGWGPSGGFVFQKAFVEFFISSKELETLLEKVQTDPQVRFYAGNKAGDFKTNMTSNDANAVTWGVFPGKEVMQPTMIEEMSFKAWKEEAFAIWNEWSLLYPPNSPSRNLLTEIADTYWLCNLVYHDFQDKQALWKTLHI